jgi:hypothetical protein
MEWFCTLINYPNILIQFEAQLRTMAADSQDPYAPHPIQSQQTSPKPPNPTTAQDKCKAAASGKIPSKPVNLLKIMKQQQAAEAKFSAAKAIHETGARREAEAPRHAEAAEK